MPPADASYLKAGLASLSPSYFSGLLRLIPLLLLVALIVRVVAGRRACADGFHRFSRPSRHHFLRDKSQALAAKLAEELGRLCQRPWSTSVQSLRATIGRAAPLCGGPQPGLPAQCAGAGAKARSRPSESRRCRPSQCNATDGFARQGLVGAGGKRAGVP